MKRPFFAQQISLCAEEHSEPLSSESGNCAILEHEQKGAQCTSEQKQFHHQLSTSGAKKSRGS